MKLLLLAKQIDARAHICNFRFKFGNGQLSGQTVRTFDRSIGIYNNSLHRASLRQNGPRYFFF